MPNEMKCDNFQSKIIFSKNDTAPTENREKTQYNWQDLLLAPQFQYEFNANECVNDCRSSVPLDDIQHDRNEKQFNRTKSCRKVNWPQNH